MVSVYVPETTLIDFHKLSPVSLKIGLIKITYDIILKKIIKILIVTYVLQVEQYRKI